jgi:hypothetical protein
MHKKLERSGGCCENGTVQATKTHRDNALQKREEEESVQCGK